VSGPAALRPGPGFARGECRDQDVRIEELVKALDVVIGGKLEELDPRVAEGCRRLYDCAASLSEDEHSVLVREEPMWLKQPSESARPAETSFPSS
jgi:hypothetical protein